MIQISCPLKQPNSFKLKKKNIQCDLIVAIIVYTFHILQPLGQSLVPMFL